MAKIRIVNRKPGHTKQSNSINVIVPVLSLCIALLSILSNIFITVFNNAQNIKIESNKLTFEAKRLAFIDYEDDKRLY